MNRLLKSLWLLTLIFSTTVYAADTFEYPELTVTPRASERVSMEASQEWGRRWTTHIPVQISSVATLAAGVIQLMNPNPSKDPNGRSGWAGVAVGGGWILATSIIDATYTPYENAAHELARMPQQTQRQQLIRERVAEEDIQDAARLGARLRWLSSASNLAANIYMAANASDTGGSKAADIIAAVASLTPFLFRYHWEYVAEEQSEYKKRIYAPIAGAGPMIEPGTGHLAPGLSLSVLF